MWPQAALNAKPAPLHAGDFDAVDYSTVLQTSSGWAMLQDGSSEGGLRSPVIALLIVGAVLLYLDHRIAR